jgi:hypothetical protein
VICMMNLFFVTMKAYKDSIQKRIHQHHHAHKTILYKGTKRLEFTESSVFNAIGGKFMYSIGEKRGSIVGDRFTFSSGVRKDLYLDGRESYTEDYENSKSKWIFLFAISVVFAAIGPLNRHHHPEEGIHPFGNTISDHIIYVCFAFGAILFFIVPIDKWISNVMASRDILLLLERLSMLTDRENSRVSNPTFYFGDMNSAQSWQRVRIEMLKHLAPLFEMFEVNLFAIFVIIFIMLSTIAVQVFLDKTRVGFDHTGNLYIVISLILALLLFALLLLTVAFINLKLSDHLPMLNREMMNILAAKEGQEGHLVDFTRPFAYIQCLITSLKEGEISIKMFGMPMTIQTIETLVTIVASVLTAIWTSNNKLA